MAQCSACYRHRRGLAATEKLGLRRVVRRSAEFVVSGEDITESLLKSCRIRSCGRNDLVQCLGDFLESLVSEYEEVLTVRLEVDDGADDSYRVVESIYMELRDCLQAVEDDSIMYAAIGRSPLGEIVEDGLVLAGIDHLIRITLRVCARVSGSGLVPRSG